MSFLPDDLEALQNATGLSDVEIFARPDLEYEYMARATMYHSLGGQGALPALALIDMLRFLGYEPPVRIPAEPAPVNWREVRRNAKVLVTLDHGVFYGEFAGWNGTSLFVCFGEDPEQHEFAPAHVSLAPSVLPADAKCAWEPVVGIGTHPAELTAAQQREAFAKSQRAAEVLDEPVPLPPVDRKQEDPVVDRSWLAAAPGDSVECMMGRGKKRRAGKFIIEGPDDGKISVLLEGDENVTVFDEGHVILLEPSA